MSIESVMPSNHLILCRPLLLLPPIPPSIRVFSNGSTLHMRWPEYWSFSFSISNTDLFPWAIRINSTSVETRVPSIRILFPKCYSPWKEPGLLGETVYMSMEAGNTDDVHEVSCNAREWVIAEHEQTLNLQDVTVSETSQREKDKRRMISLTSGTRKRWAHRNWEYNCGFQKLGSM